MTNRVGGLAKAKVDPAVADWLKDAQTNKAALTKKQKRDMKRVRVKYDLDPKLKTLIEAKAKRVGTSAAQLASFRVTYAAGFTGLGGGATRFAAETLLDLLSGAETERTRLEMVRRKPVPFPPEPLASVGIHLTRWSLDRADHREGRRNPFLRALDAAGLGFDS